jgi:hypothetical protein
VVEPLPVVLSLGDVVAGGVVIGGGGVVGGDADGVRSAGRSPSRSLRDSEQAVRRPALSASAHRPVSNFFIGASRLGFASQDCGLQRACPPP